MIMELNIGAKVRVNNRGGEIVDKLRSSAQDCTLYRIKFDGETNASNTLYKSEMFDSVVTFVYSWELEVVENLVAVRFYQVDTDGNKTELTRGHGHIIHEGAYGIAQAASYALRRIMQNLEDVE